MAKTNSTKLQSIDFDAPLTEAQLDEFEVASGKQMSDERKSLLDEYDGLESVNQGFWYPVEKGKDAKKTRDSVAPFLTREGRPAKVSLAKERNGTVITNFILIRKVAPKPANTKTKK